MMRSHAGMASRSSQSLFSKPGTLWFETAGDGSKDGEALLFSDPVDTLTLTSLSGLNDFFLAIERKRDAGFFLAGWLSYEAGCGFESQAIRSSSSASGTPLAWFGVYETAQCFTGADIDTFVAGRNEREPFVVSRLCFDYDADDYVAVIRAIKEQIAAGNVYQVNFTGRYRFAFSGSPQALFLKMRSSQPSAYTAVLNTGDRLVLSLSPELFFRCSGGIIETMPMKGTAPRGETPEEDASMKLGLSRCEKNRAENLMIVDLLRNDLGRICLPGSVHASELFATETYPTLHQMVSTIRGRLAEHIGLYDIFRALFPSGSVTGAPKISAMQLIGELEPTPRGVYTGAIGIVKPDGDMVFNVAIRTIEIFGKTGTYGSGSGIVWDSDPLQEFRECMLKARILSDEVQEIPELFETLLWAGRYLWLDEHLERIRTSAATLGVPFQEDEARCRLARLDRALAACGGRFKVRLRLSGEGRITVGHEPVDATPSEKPLKLCSAAERIASTDFFRYHKTGSRKLYDRFYRLALDHGFNEVVFFNERGEVAEAAVSNIIIRCGTHYYTPPVTSGLLDGIYRSYFLRTRSQCIEKVLFIEDLFAADVIYLCNSVRGMRRAVFDGTQLAGNGS
ncbi:aminodeoxychorismate synthase component I [Chlorobium limicola]|nr:aminodeoxychorismate synthase component I [Chlorobium limicola]